MSTATNVLNTSNQAITNFDTTKVFLRDNKFETGTFTNDDSYDDVTLVGGTLLGRISATNKLVPHSSSASDGSQFPVGILAHTITVQESDDAELTFCTAGEVAAGKLILASGDTLATVISGRTINDRIKSDTAGVILVGADQLTAFDNQ